MLVVVAVEVHELIRWLAITANWHEWATRPRSCRPLLSGSLGMRESTQQIRYAGNSFEMVQWFLR